jgi:hypothetical protein
MTTQSNAIPEDTIKEGCFIRTKADMIGIVRRIEEKYIVVAFYNISVGLLVSAGITVSPNRQANQILKAFKEDLFEFVVSPDDITLYAELPPAPAGTTPTAPPPVLQSSGNAQNPSRDVLNSTSL